MAIEKTLAIIKPDSLEKGIIGEICKRIEDASLKIVGVKMLKLNQARAEGFYAVHKDKPFFDSLVKQLQGENVADFLPDLLLGKRILKINLPFKVRF